MAYTLSGMQALFPVYLSRMAQEGDARDDYDASVALNESNLNQNLEILRQKMAAIESYLSSEST